MAVTCTARGRTLTARISGELDHHRAREVMAELDRQVDEQLPAHLVLELGELSFTDSSGIAVLLRAHRRMGELGGTMTVSDTPEQARRVFWAAGLNKLISFGQGGKPPRE